MPSEHPNLYTCATAHVQHPCDQWYTVTYHQLHTLYAGGASRSSEDRVLQAMSQACQRQERDNVDVYTSEESLSHLEQIVMAFSTHDAVYCMICCNYVDSFGRIIGMADCVR